MSVEAVSVEEPPPRYACRQTIQGHRRAVSSVKFSPDGKLLSSSSADMTVKVCMCVVPSQLSVLTCRYATLWKLHQPISSHVTPRR